MTDPLTRITTKATAQTRPLHGPDGARQVQNAAGGYVFEVNDETKLRRFLTLGTTGGTYYADENKLTFDNAKAVLAAATGDRASALVDLIVEISTAGRAPRQQPALFALAAASKLGDDEGKSRAYASLPLVARTATHLFTYIKYLEQFGGWGNGTKRAVARWYTERDVDRLAYQLVKYRQREGWTHRDVLRMAHPTTADSRRRALFDWVTHGGATAAAHPLPYAFTRAQETNDPTEWARLAESYDLSWEMFPDAALAQPAVWEALIAKGMPMTALMRQLPRLTRLGVLTQTSEATRTVTRRLTDADLLREARVHPMNVLVALRTYASGHSVRGSSTWTPIRQVTDALDGAFYAAFLAVEPANKRTLVAVDVSGSMGWSTCGGLEITPAEAAGALAVVTLATEPNTVVTAFSSSLVEVDLSARRRLDDNLRTLRGITMGTTDCAAPMQYATENRLEIDTFIVLTDNETWYGDVHPVQALRTYRERTGIHARLAVVGMTAVPYSIADPNDPGSLDVEGMDSAVPTLLADFSRRAV